MELDKGLAAERAKLALRIIQGVNSMFSESQFGEVQQQLIDEINGR